MVSFTLKAGIVGCLLASIGVEAVPDSSAWSYVSCFLNRTPETSRTLGYKKTVPAGADGMTVKACQDVCLASGMLCLSLVQLSANEINRVFARWFG